MTWGVSVAPTTEPVSLAEAKAHLNMTGANRDAVVAGLIASARTIVETGLNRAIMPQKWLGTFSCLDTPHRLAGGKVRAIDSIQYYDSANVLQTLASAAYYAILDEPAKVAPVEEWPDLYPRIDAVRITLSVGWADADSVPASIKSAILLQLELLHDRPVGDYAQALERSRESLLFPYRAVLV